MPSDVIDRADSSDSVQGASTAFLFAPILRYGRLISARDTSRSDDQRFVFTTDKIGEAIQLLKEEADTFLDIVEQYFTDRSPAWKVERLNPDAEARPLKKMGAVVDFPDLKISIDDCVNIVRLSVTVCVDKYGDLSKLRSPVTCESQAGICFVPNGSPVTLFSKIWVRTACVSYDGDGACNQSDKHTIAFAEEFETFSREIVDLVEGPYRELLTTLAGLNPQTVETRNQGELINLMISSDDESLRRLRDEIKRGTFVIANCGSLARTGYQQLFETYFDELNRLGGTPEAIGCKDLRAFDHEFTKGVLVADRVDNTTRVFGAAHSPFWSREEFEDSKRRDVRWRNSPGHVLGAIAMTALASRL